MSAQLAVAHRTLLLLALAMIALACSPSTGSPAPTTGASPSASPWPTQGSGQPTTTASPTDPLAAVLVDEIEQDGSPDFPSLGFGSIWFLLPDQDDPAVARVDPASAEVIAEVPGAGRLCQATGATPEGIWTCTNAGVARIDPTTNLIDAEVELQIGPFYGLLPYGGDALWALGGDQNRTTDHLIRIDPVAAEVIDRVPLGFSGANLAYGFDAVWISAPAEGKLYRFDPATGELTEHASGLDHPRWVTAGFESVWVSLYDSPDASAPADAGTIARIDPVTGDLDTTIALGGNPQGAWIFAGSDSVWIRSSDPFVARIDPATNEVTLAIRANFALGGLVELDGELWVSAEAPFNRIWHLRP